MTNTMLKAWSAGLGVIFVAYVAWFTLLWSGVYSKPFVFILWASPSIAAFVSAYIGPSKKIFLGASMAIPSAVLAVVFNAAYQMLGNSIDFPGFKGAVLLFSITLIYASLMSVIGGIGGYILARRRGSD